MLFDHIEEKEAVKTAALIEDNGYRFYTLLSENTTDARTKAAFKKLAEDEKKHLKILEKKFFPAAGLTEEITEEELVIEGYLEKSGIGDIFTRRVNVAELIKLIDTPRKALIIALDTERYSVKYFENLSSRSQTEEGRKIYRGLLEEEKSHVSQIESMLAANP